MGEVEYSGRKTGVSNRVQGGGGGQKQKSSRRVKKHSLCPALLPVSPVMYMIYIEP